MTNGLIKRKVKSSCSYPTILNKASSDAFFCTFAEVASAQALCMLNLLWMKVLERKMKLFQKKIV